ncbi:MAG TPA: ribonuclease H [Candidatus Paceibacterota bacterium]|nr:ribonuclease H [Candidatus Paceibacterota bacterium]
MEHILVFTDGAAKGNPGPGGYGAIIVRQGKVSELGGRAKHTTNNEMELRAVVVALTHIGNTSNVVMLYTDSKYVVEGAQKWVYGWMKNGWRTKGDTDVLHKALWQELTVLLKNTRVEWHKIPGHSGVVGNTRADAIASSFGKGESPILYSGRITQYPYDITSLAYEEAVAQSRSEARKRQVQKAYSYVSEVDGVVQVHATWLECEARVRGKRARFKKALNAEEEREIARTFSA